eukprot:401635-Lingulodinium_polyedra.AAC.1
MDTPTAWLHLRRLRRACRARGRSPRERIGGRGSLGRSGSAPSSRSRRPRRSAVPGHRARLAEAGHP